MQAMHIPCYNHCLHNMLIKSIKQASEGQFIPINERILGKSNMISKEFRKHGNLKMLEEACKSE